MPSNDTVDNSPGGTGLPSTGGHSPEVCELLLDAGGLFAAFSAVRAARAEVSASEGNRTDHAWGS